MDIRRPREDTHALGGDVAVGNVNLATILSRHGVAVEFEIPIVDLQKAIALADDRVVPTLDRRARRGRALALDTRRRGCRSAFRSRLYRVARAGLESAATGGDGSNIAIGIRDLRCR